MPDVEPVVIKQDNTPPPTQGKQPYGQSDMYKKSMPK